MIDTISNYKSEAAANGNNYFAAASDQVERDYPEASHDARCIAASNVAISMALDALATAVSGSAEYSPLSAALVKFLGDDA